MTSDEAVLPVDLEPVEPFLSAADGRPVWPVASREDQEALVRIVKLFAGRLEHVRGSPGRNEVGAGLVVGLGREVHEDALLYAHLTGRDAETIESADHLADVRRPEVLVTSPRRLSLDVLLRLYGAADEVQAPGILCADPGPPLRRQVIVRSAAAALSGPLEVSRIDVFPVAEGAGTEPLHRLEAGAGVLTVLTHSDGIDAFLGSRTVCPMDRPPEGLPRAGSPLCVVTGVCHRHDTTVDEALRSDLLSPPEALRARILIWNVCWGLMLEPSVVDPAWGLAPRLLASSTLGAIVTPWEVVLARPEDTGPLAAALEAGVPVGVALRDFSLLQHVRERGLRMCLLGDPRVRLPASRARSALAAVPTESSASPREQTWPDADGAAFAMAYLRSQQPLLPESLEGPAREAIRHIEAYQEAKRTGSTLEESDDAPGPSLRRALLGFLLERGSIPFHDWSRITDDPRVMNREKRCFHCGHPATTFAARLRLPGRLERRLVICPACGIVEDAPFALPSMTFRIEGGRTIRLTGVVPREHWAAALALEYRLRSLRRRWHWPVAPDGTPEPTFTTPEAWPAGPLCVALFLMEGAQLSIARSPARGEAPAPRRAEPPRFPGDSDS